MYNAVYYDEYGIHLNLRGLEKWSEKVDERLAAIEENIKPEFIVDFDISKMRALGDGIGIINGSFVSEKLYNELEAKHEADCRLISEYDLEIKKLEKKNVEQNDDICTLYSKYASEAQEHFRCEAVIEDKNKQIAMLEFNVEKLKEDVERWVNRDKRLRDMDKKRLFDLKNAENERDHYKDLYSSKCDDYDNLLEKQMKTEGERERCEKLLANANDDYAGLQSLYKETFEANVKLKKLNKKYDEELTAIKNAPRVNTYDYAELMSKYKDLEEKLKETEEKYNDACVLNKMREDVFEANIKLQKTIEAKDREINLLRAELDKYKTDDECDDRWID